MLRPRRIRNDALSPDLTHRWEAPPPPDRIPPFLFIRSEAAEGLSGALVTSVSRDSRRLSDDALVEAVKCRLAEAPPTERLTWIDPITGAQTPADVTRPWLARRLRVTVDQPEGMILYLKGRFLPADAPDVAEQLAFDRKLIEAGIVDEDGRGPRYAELQDMLRQRKLKRGQAGPHG